MTTKDKEYWAEQDRIYQTYIDRGMQKSGIMMSVNNYWCVISLFLSGMSGGVALLVDHYDIASFKLTWFVLSIISIPIARMIAPLMCRADEKFLRAPD